MKFIKTMTTIVICTVLLTITIDVVRFPDCYITTWKYQLHNEILRGEPEAIEYYQKTYVDKGRVLF